jgi:sulfur relay (sulfurtransferase) complex TusBCD TusD component (DsrE family)
MKALVLTARDPLRAADGSHGLRLAADLAGQGHDVVLALLEDAVVAVREAHQTRGALDAALSKGVRVLVEDEAAARRGIAPPDGVEPASIGEVTELLLSWSERQAWV